MTCIVNNIFLAVKILGVFLAFFILIPVLFIRSPKNDDFWGKCFMGFAFSNFVIIVLVHILAILNIYESLSLLLCCSIVFLIANLFFKKYRDNKTELKIATAFLQYMDSKEAFFKVCMNLLIKKIKSALYYFLKSIKAWFKGSFEHIMLSANLFALIFIRFKNSILHAYLSMPDMYVHLAWAKYLGQNMLYSDSLYPRGYECIISCMNKLFFIDPYIILRFMGPIAGVLLVFSIYYSIKKNYANLNLPLWISITILILPSILPADALRMSSALPYEYSVIFILPGIEFFKDYFESKRVSKLLSACLCLADILLIHPRAAVYIILGFALVSAIYAHRYIDLNFLIKTIGAVSISIVIGCMPLLIGYILKAKSMRFIDIIIRNALSYDNAVKGFNLVEIFKMDWIHILFFILMISYAVIIVIQALSKEFNIIMVKRDVFNLLFSIGAFIIFKAEYIGIPILIDTNRAGLLFSLVFVIVLIQPLRIFGFFIKYSLLKRVAANMLCISLLVIILVQHSISIPNGIQLEYEGAARSYLSIRQAFPGMRWTIVSPVEQYQESFGYGWHYNIWEFAHRLESVNEMSITIPSDFVFIFVEKKPLGCDYEVSDKYAQMELPIIQGFKDQYYRNPYYRSIIESKIYFWAEDYLGKNDNMSVYYEDEEMKIYLLRQDSRNPDNLK